MKLKELIECSIQAYKHHGDIDVLIYTESKKTVPMDAFYAQKDDRGSFVILTPKEDK